MALTATITGTLQDATGAIVPNGVITATLANYGNNVPTVQSGNTAIVVQPVVSVVAASDGTFSFTLYGNDVITPSGTVYVLSFANANRSSVGTASYSFHSNNTYNLNSYAPNVTYPIPAAVGPVNATQIQGINVLKSAPSNGQVLTYVAANGDIEWSTQIGGVTSVFGRTGAVVAQAGDYSFSLLSGSLVTSQMPSDYFKVNGTSIASQSVNLQNGSNITVQNSGGGAVTISMSGVLPNTITSAAHKWLNSYDATSGNFTQTQPDYSDLTGTPSLAAIATSGRWSDLQAASASLTLANAANATTFNQTSAVNWTWANTTAATNTTSQSSPIFNLNGTYWNGSASATETLALQNVIANGTNGAVTTTWSYTGSTGAIAWQINFPSGGFNKITWGEGTITIGNDLGAQTLYNPSGLNLLGSGGGSISLAATVVFTANGAGSFTFNRPFTQYNGITCVANGIPAEYAQANLTAQSANVAATTLYAVPSTGAGIYRVSVYLVVSRAATTSSTLPDSRIIYTDADSGATITVPLTAGNTGNTTSTAVYASAIINAKASTNIQYDIGQVTGYASSGATSMQFAYHSRLEAL